MCFMYHLCTKVVFLHRFLICVLQPLNCQAGLAQAEGTNAAQQEMRGLSLQLLSEVKVVGLGLRYPGRDGKYMA